MIRMLTAEKGSFTMESIKTAEVEFLEKLYKNVKMGADSIAKLLQRTEEGELKKTLEEQMKGFQEFVSSVGKEIIRLGETPKDENAFTKFWAGVGMTMNTLMDMSDSHIAEIMIQGMTMGGTDTLKVMSEYRKETGNGEIVKMASGIVDFQEKCIETLKNYL